MLNWQETENNQVRNKSEIEGDRAKDRKKRVKGGDAQIHNHDGRDAVGE